MLDPDLMALLGPGTSLVVGTVAPDGEPVATRAFATEIVDPGTNRLRIVVSADDPDAVANLTVGSSLAVTGGDVRTLRSAQVKGTIVLVDAVTEADRTAMADANERFVEEIVLTDGTPPELVRRLLPNEVMAVELEVTERYDQSPGPSAGAPLTGTP